MLRPFASSARAFAATSNAVSVPSRPKRRASGLIAFLLACSRPAFDAGASVRPHDGRMPRARVELHAVSRAEADRLPVREAELDRAAHADEELAVRVRVLAVGVVRPIRPLGPARPADIVA